MGVHHKNALVTSRAARDKSKRLHREGSRQKDAHGHGRNVVKVECKLADHADKKESNASQRQDRKP
jgi:hypothetical protein